MKTLLFFILISGTAFAQDHSEILYYRGRSLGPTPDKQIAKTKEILALVEKITDAVGISTTIKNFSDRSGNSYPAMVIDTSGSSALNVEAARVASAMGSLPLVFSPFDLGRSGADAFFDPAGTKLGVSYEFILGDKTSSSYIHELYHATTYLNVLSNKPTLWAGVMKLVNGQYMSGLNNQYYFRFASLDELPSTALSLKIDTQKILELKRTQSPAEFNKSRGEAGSLLGEIYLSAKAGYYLARQAKDLAQRALSASAKDSQTPLKLGSIAKSLPTSMFLLSSYSWEIVGGRGTNQEVKDGTELKLYWPGTYTEASLKQRLTDIINRSAKAEEAFKKTEKCVYVLIEYPDVAKTDYRCLATQGPLAFGYLD